MKRIATILVLSAGLASGPAMAGKDSRESKVGGAIGAGVGAVLGHSLGKGDSRIATTAVGAVGGYLLGRELGDKSSRRDHPTRSAHSGRRWEHPVHRGHRDYHEGRRHGRYHRYGPRIRPINKTYVTRTRSNVRAGPSTRFRVVDQLHYRERVHVIGKVRGRDWYLIRDHGQRGFVYAPLLRRPHHGYRGHGHRDYRRHHGGYHYRH